MKTGSELLRSGFLWLAALALTFVFSPAYSSNWITVPAGQFIMGDSQGDANEKPVQVDVGKFQIMQHEVTNKDFKAFIKATGYITDTSRNGKAYVWTNKWRKDSNASYLHPHGKGSSIKQLDNHPVVQVSNRDAQAYCMYHDARLPTEAEWEFAARGTDGRRYPWGNQLPVQGFTQALANYGTDNCCAAEDADGFATTAPVGSYPKGQSPFGIHDMAGNVWEWTSTPFPGKPSENVIRGGGWGNNRYCLRVSYRHGNPPDIGLNMVGFRCAR